jgi:hypothetical protein
MDKELILKLASLASVTAAVLALATCTACNSTGTSHVLDNLQGCTRHYDGTVSAGMTGGQFAGTVKVDCTPANTSVPFTVGGPGNSYQVVKPGSVVGNSTTPAGDALPPA